jgi:hypothetical protein
VFVDRGSFSVDVAGFYRAGSSGFIHLAATARSLAGTILADAPYRITPDLPRADNIAFTGPTPGMSRFGADVREASWNQPYAVAITIRNPCPFASATVNLSLFEAENMRDHIGGILAATESPATAVQSMMLTLTPGEVRAVTFAPITRQWAWLTPHAWIVTGPVLRGFTHDVRFTVSDEFGNVYPETRSGSIIVEVSVPQEKINAYTAALGLAISAAIAAGIGAFWPPALAVAGALYVVAESFGAVAQDPAQPDPKFEETVAPEEPDLPAAFMKDAGLSNLRAWLTAASRIAAIQITLSQIEGKILGARQALHNLAESLQTRRYAKYARQMIADSEEMHNAVAGAVKDLLQHADLDQVEAKFAEWKKKGIPPQDGAILAKEIPVEILGILIDVLRQNPSDRLNLAKLLEEITNQTYASVRKVIEDAMGRYYDLLAARQEKSDTTMKELA